MALIVGWCDVEKCQLKWLRVLDCVRGLGFESYVWQLCVVVLLLNFNNMYEYGIDDVNCF